MQGTSLLSSVTGFDGRRVGPGGEKSGTSRGEEGPSSHKRLEEKGLASPSWGPLPGGPLWGSGGHRCFAAKQPLRDGKLGRRPAPLTPCKIPSDLMSLACNPGLWHPLSVHCFSPSCPLTTWWVSRERKYPADPQSRLQQESLQQGVAGEKLSTTVLSIPPLSLPPPIRALF